MNSRTTDEFWEYYGRLPESVCDTAKRNYELWKRDHRHPSLHFKCVKEAVPQVFSIRVGRKYRALGLRENEGEQDVITWFWIGIHSEYDKLIENL